MYGKPPKIELFLVVGPLNCLKNTTKQDKTNTLLKCSICFKQF